MYKKQVCLTEQLPKAQSSRLDFTSVLSDPLLRLINANANAIGAPAEFILYPLLTAVASCMGTSASVQINPEWNEPSILWFVIAARKGERKTAALKRIRKPFEEIEADMRQQWQENDATDKPDHPPQLIVDYFSFEKLHSILVKNGGQVLGCFDEMSSFYGQLDLFKPHGSTVDRKTLLTLNGGGAWSRNFRTYSASVPKTAFNITGFIQPAFVFQMLHSADQDGLNDRQLFDFPPERDVFLRELKVPVPHDIPTFKDIFTQVITQHQDNVKVYTFDREAYLCFEQAHDALVQEKIKAVDENVQGILSKARGYTARLAMILHCLEQALSRAESTSQEESEEAWSTVITPAAVRNAATMIQHLNQQKFLMLGVDGNSSEHVSHRVVRLLSMESKSGDGVIHPSELAQKHISEKVGQSYPISKAIELMEEAAHLGFGDIETVSTPNNRKVKRFRKHTLDELTEQPKELLKKAKLSNTCYNKSFNQEARRPLAELQSH